MLGKCCPILHPMTRAKASSCVHQVSRGLPTRVPIGNHSMTRLTQILRRTRRISDAGEHMCQTNFACDILLDDQKRVGSSCAQSDAMACSNPAPVWDPAKKRSNRRNSTSTASNNLMCRAMGTWLSHKCTCWPKTQGLLQTNGTLCPRLP